MHRPRESRNSKFDQARNGVSPCMIARTRVNPSASCGNWEGETSTHRSCPASATVHPPHRAWFVPEPVVPVAAAYLVWSVVNVRNLFSANSPFDEGMYFAVLVSSDWSELVQSDG